MHWTDELKPGDSVSVSEGPWWPVRSRATVAGVAPLRVTMPDGHVATFDQEHETFSGFPVMDGASLYPSE